jgi:hypothetical protein
MTRVLAHEGRMKRRDLINGRLDRKTNKTRVIFPLHVTLRSTLCLPATPVMAGLYVVEQLSKSENHIEAESLDPLTDRIVQ